MSKNTEIWNEVYNILEQERQNGNLRYIKRVFQGTREDVVNFPVIIIEPDTEREEQHTTPLYKRCFFTILLTCWFEVINKDKQIVGSLDDKGILNMSADIKATLFKYPSLNNKCLKFSFPTTRYVFETYPYRGVEITMEIEYIVEATQR